MQTRGRLLSSQGPFGFAVWPNCAKQHRGEERDNRRGRNSRSICRIAARESRKTDVSTDIVTAMSRLGASAAMLALSAAAQAQEQVISYMPASLQVARIGLSRKLCRRRPGIGEAGAQRRLPGEGGFRAAVVGL